MEFMIVKVWQFLFVSTLIGGVAFADTYVPGHTRKDGTYVPGYTRSSPDQYRNNNKGSQTRGGSQRDEYSSQGGATNRSNPSYGYRDNDADGTINPYDKAPETKGDSASPYLGYSAPRPAPRVKKTKSPW
jgi:hypothetical protein